MGSSFRHLPSARLNKTRPNSPETAPDRPNIATNTTDVSGDCLLIDSTASNFSSRFYRTTVAN